MQKNLLPNQEEKKMNLITKNSVNNCYFTLTEKATLTSPYYLFVLESIDSGKVTIFSADDISSNTDRYNKFIITETGSTTNYTAGTISLTVGEYNYTAYEMTGRTNLDISGTTGIVEVGQIFVSGSTSTSYTYTDTDDDETAVYFNN